jgi:hypothetical protein
VAYETLLYNNFTIPIFFSSKGDLHTGKSCLD